MKGAMVSSTNSNAIEWTIDVNKNLENLQDVSIEDTIPDGLTLDGNIKIIPLEINLNGVITEKIDDTITAGGFTINLGNIGSTAYRLKFRTDITGTQDEFTNTATINYTKDSVPGSDNSDPETVSITIKDPLEKISGVPDVSKNPDHITWTLHANLGERSLANAYIKDTLALGLRAPTTATMYKLEQQGENFVRANPGESRLISIDSDSVTINPDGTTTFEIELGNITEAWEIVYDTDIKDFSPGMFTGLNVEELEVTFDNTADLYAGGDTDPLNDTPQTQESNPFVIGSFIYKDGEVQLGYSGKNIDWTIDINGIKQTIEDEATLTDSIPKGLELKEENVKIFRNGTDVTSSYTINISGDAKSGTTLEIVFDTIDAADTYQVQYTTRITDLGDLGGSVFDSDDHADLGINIGNFENNAALTWNKVPGDGSGGQHNLEVDISKTIAQNSITKQAESAINYQAKTIDWRITIDPRLEPMKGLKITDTFPEGGLQLWELTVDGTKIFEDGAPNGITSPAITKIDAGDAHWRQGFVLDFGATDLANKTYIINYTTKFDRNWLTNGNKKTNGYQNKFEAEWKETSSGDTILEHKPQPVTKNIGTTARNNGRKTGTLNRLAREITWELYTNYLSEEFTDFKITDQFGEEQDLLPESLNIYPYTVNSSGTETVQPALTEADIYVKFAITTGPRGFTIEAKPGVTIDTPYKIEYKTQLRGESQPSYSNNATISGTDINDKESTDTATATVTFSNSSDFLNKTGTKKDNNSREINWQVTMNRSLSEISEATLTDTLGGLHVYLEDSVRVFKVTGNNPNPSTGTHVQEITNQEPKPYTLTFSTDLDSGNQSLELKFLEKITAQYIITYQTLFISEDSGVNQSVSNTANFLGKGFASIEDEDNPQETIKTVQFSQGGGWASANFPPLYKKIEVTLRKIDGDTRTPIISSGVKFRLRDSEGQLVSENDIELTSGQAVVKGLKMGTYYLEEIAGPDGYQLPEEPYELNITANPSQQTFDIKNYKDRKVKIVKGTLDADDNFVTNSAEFAGAEFVITKMIDFDLDEIDLNFPPQTEITKADGTLEFSGLPFGKYKITETQAPRGYQPPSSPIKIIISDAGVVFDASSNTSGNIITVGSPNKEQIELKVPNEVQKGVIAFDKLGEDGKALTGATFELRRESDDALMDTETSNGSGRVTFLDVPFGKYYIIETAVPTGYDRITERIVVEIDEDGDAIFDSEKIVNGKIHNLLLREQIIVTKLDFDYRFPVSGAQFRLTADDGNIVKLGNDRDLTELIASSGDDGKAVFGFVPYGNYTIEEIGAPNGYQLSDEIINIREEDFLSEPEPKRTSFEFTNHRQRAVKVTIVRENMPETKLAGAEFTLTKQDDPDFSMARLTDTDGIAEFTGLAFGTYILKETRPPSGYRANPDFEERIVFEEPTQADPDTVYVREFTVENKRRPSGGGGGGTPPPPVPEPEVPEKPEEPVKPEEQPEKPKELEDPNKPGEQPGGPEDPNKPGEQPGGPEDPNKPEEQPEQSEDPNKPEEQPEQPDIKEYTPEETPVKGGVEVPEQSVPEVKEPPKNGTVTINEDGTWEYTPEPGFAGKDTFRIVIKHPDGTEEEIFIEIEVGEIPLGAVVPPGVNQLPKTGEVNPVVFYALGFGMILTGAVLLRRSKVLRGKLDS